MNFLAFVLICTFPALVWPYKQVRSGLGSRIIGGHSAYAGQFPYAAALTVQTADSRYFCGGSLIDRQWILTAGQCVDGATLFTIALGSNSLNNADPNRVTVASSEYFSHPDYNAFTLENDIGLIKLRLPVEYSNYLNQVSFLGEYFVVDGTLLMAFGWGQTADDDPGFSNDLQWAGVVAMSTEECQLTYGDQISSSTICIDGNFNEGSCYGDTGSGLIQDIGRGYSMHVGIASFISSNGCESPDPSGYIRTYPYVNWIRNITSANF